MKMEIHHKPILFSSTCLVWRFSKHWQIAHNRLWLEWYLMAFPTKKFVHNNQEHYHKGMLKTCTHLSCCIPWNIDISIFYKINLAITNWDILCNEIEFQLQGLSSYIGYALRIFHMVHVTNLDIFSYIFLWGHTSCNLLGHVLLHILMKGKLDRTHWKNWIKRCAYQIKNVNNKVCIREIHSFTTFHVVLIKNIDNFIPLTRYN